MRAAIAEAINKIQEGFPNILEMVRTGQADLLFPIIEVPHIWMVTPGRTLRPDARRQSESQLPRLEP